MEGILFSVVPPSNSLFMVSVQNLQRFLSLHAATFKIKSLTTLHHLLFPDLQSHKDSIRWILDAQSSGIKTHFFNNDPSMIQKAKKMILSLLPDLFFTRREKWGKCNTTTRVSFSPSSNSSCVCVCKFCKAFMSATMAPPD